MIAPRGLHALARLHGIQTAYRDNEGRRVSASPEALIATLRALDVPVRDGASVARLLSHRRRQLWERAIDPVVVVWTSGGLDGQGTGWVHVRAPARRRDADIRVTVQLEAGGERTREAAGSSLEVRGEVVVGSARFVDRRVRLPPVPPGYHDLIVEVAGGRGRARHEALLIAAPERACGWEVLPGADGDLAGRWGLFAPLHALWQGASPRAQAPTFPLLTGLAERAGESGASLIGTLPLLAAFLDRPYEPSPYAPVSRLFWNELYLAPADGVPGPAGAEDTDLFDPRAAMAARRTRPEEEA
ncbi:MAG: hypothetical protein ACLFRX_06155, partial [Gemmatimonadota bacterium]